MLAFCCLMLLPLRADEAAGAAGLDDVFHRPPTSARSWVYWYWMNAAVTRDGIAADLAAMKEAGIEGAYLMPIKGAAQPPLINPPVVQLTPAWWDCVRYAFSEADRLGLKLALHDCDGFATAGGPWITPERSMQKVVWSEIEIDGGRAVAVTLPQPTANEGFYREIATFAVPDVRAAGSTGGGVATVTSSVAGPSPQFLADGGRDQVFRADRRCWIQYAFPRPFTCRAITIRLPPAPNAYQPNTYQANRLAVEASDDGEHFHAVAQLVPPRHGWQDGDADITHAIPAVTARYFRFVYDPAGAEPGAEDLDSAKWKPTLKMCGILLSSAPQIDGFEGKSGAVWRVGPPTTVATVGVADCVPVDRVLQISQHVDALGRLAWDAPPGRWRILRMGHTSTGHFNDTGGGGRGLECDKFDPAVVRFQFDHWFAEAVRQIGPELAHRVLTVFHVDSWECASQNWSSVFRTEFQRRRGYDPLPYLPIMAGVPLGSADLSERFLRDVRTTIAEVLVDNFFGTMAQLAHAAGCTFTAESVAPTMVGDGMAHFAQVDVPMGEFWLRSPTHDKLNDILDAVSGAHVYGRRIVQSEAFTELGLRWDEAPAMLKTLQDRNYCLGVNRLVYHVFVANPWTDRRPGLTLGGVGLFFQRDQTWWDPGREWVEYAARCQALLQQGHPVADVAVFTGEEIPRRAWVPWHLAATLPRMIAPRTAVPADRKLPLIREAADWVDPLHGYAYDSINRDALVRLAHVRDGRLELPGGASYHVLVLPTTNPMDPIANELSPEIAEKVREFAASGGKVILGARPNRSPGRARSTSDDERVAQIAEELWPVEAPSGGTSTALGNGRIARGPFPEATFTSLGVKPDLVVVGEKERQRDLAWTHRAGGDWDLYFLSNQLNEARQFTVSLRVAHWVPELWDAVTGEQQVAPDWRAVDGRTELSLRLAPAGSLFVVFRKTSRPTLARSENRTREVLEVALPGPWRVSFDPTHGGPKQPVVFARLGSWTSFDDPAVKYFAGTATYSTDFVWRQTGSKVGRVWLDLGDVREIAEVKVNGTLCGVAWTPPYRVEIDQALREGANRLDVAVTNTWFNRLAADQEVPEAQRSTWTTAPDRTKGKPLMESGLLGPVVLHQE